MTTKKMVLENIYDSVLGMLKDKLSSELSYHNYEHTLDVVKAAERIAKEENATMNDILLLKTAAVFHDVGYMYTRNGHEEKSCSIATEMLSQNGISDEEINKVCELIMATKVPQSPKDKLAKILCDADLDYLGRDDYFRISRNVFNEFKHFGVVRDENDWREMQVKFLEAHHYFTETSKKSRNRQKEENLKQIKENHQ